MADLLKVAVVIWEDSNFDTDIDVFLDADQAVAYAREKARKYGRHGDLDETLTPAMVEEGWLYRGRYSCEGDNIRVVTRKVKE
ncbi:hypothetical protein ACFXG4_03870 [Nocardia sp. NPDC059246]|uniref:hypothetical protein n=1 Tax=unclassified Nocardia TaxID=2637762 RepID=UPI003674D23B